jgi:hypothetical protein
MPVAEQTITEMGVITEEGIKTIRFRRIDSSNIDWIGWPATGEPTMIVQFKGGSRYAYLGVSRQRAVACAYAESTGRFLNTKIKPFYDIMKLR